MSFLNYFKKINKDNILNFGIIVLIFFTPLVVFKNIFLSYITSHTFFFYGLTNFLFFYWVYLLILDKSYWINRKDFLVFIPVFLFIFWMTLAGILGVNFKMSFWSSFMRGTGLLTLYYCLILSLIIFSLIKKKGIKYFYKIIKVFLFSSFIFIIPIWLSGNGFVLFSPIFKNSNDGGFIGNSSLAGTYLIFSIFLFLFLFFNNKISKIIKKVLILGFFLIIFSPLFLNLHGLFSGSAGGLLGSARGALLGIILGVGVSVLIYFILSTKKVSKILGIIGLFLSIIFFIVGWIQLEKPNTKLHNKFIQVASGTRFVFWDISKESLKQKPLLGYGPENYFIAFQDNFDSKILSDEYGMEGWGDRAHNIFYETGVSGGYPAILFYFLFLSSLLYVSYKLYKQNKISRIQTSLLFGLIIAYIFQNLFVFDSPLSLMALFMLTGLIYGLFSYRENETIDEKIKIKLISKIFIITILITLCILSIIFFTILPIKKNKDFYKFVAPTERLKNNHEILLKGSKIGDDWDVSSVFHSLLKVYYKNLNKIKADKKLTESSILEIKSLTKYLDKITEKNKQDIRLYLVNSAFYEILIVLSDENDPDKDFYIKKSLNLIEEAKEISPNNLMSYWIEAGNFLRQGDYNKTKEIYEKALEICPENPNTYYQYIELAKKINNKELLQEIIFRAKENIPDFSL